MVQSVYRFRWLLVELVTRDIVLRYRGSVLGFLWTILNPLLAMLVYTFVFSVVLRVAIPHYAVFLLAGLLPWMWFASSISAGTTSVVDGRGYIVRASFAPELLVLTPICANAVNFALSIPIYFVVAALFGVPVGWPLLVLPVIVGIQALLSFGIASALATWDVFFRDLQQLIVTILSLLFYLTPIFYPLQSVPEVIRPYIFINPMSALIIAYQDVLFYNRLPEPKLLGYALLIAVAFVVLGTRVFGRYKESFADYA